MTEFARSNDWTENVIHFQVRGASEVEARCKLATIAASDVVEVTSDKMPFSDDVEYTATVRVLDPSFNFDLFVAEIEKKHLRSDPAAVLRNASNGQYNIANQNIMAAGLTFDLPEPYREDTSIRLCREMMIYAALSCPLTEDKTPHDISSALAFFFTAEQIEQARAGMLHIKR